MLIQHPPGYFASIATVWLRLMAILLLLYALMSVVYAIVWSSRAGGAGVILYAVGGIVLWVTSGPLGRLAGRGLDDSGSGPPAV